MRYYEFLNEKFDKMFLTEEQQVVINFKNIFGTDMYNLFKTKKARLSNPANDISYWVRRYNEEGASVIDELSNLLSSNVIKRDIEGKRIPDPENTKVKVAENDDYIVYYVSNVGDMIDLATTKIGDFAGGYWCIAGRYSLGDAANDVGIDKDDAIKVSQAEYYFDLYLNDSYQAYFVCMPKNEDCQKHCLCFTSDTTCEDWNTMDKRDMMDEDFYNIPEFEFNNFKFEGQNSIREEDWPEEEDNDFEPEEPEGEPAPREPEAFELIPVEDPNALEFPARSKEEAVRLFKNDGEIVDTIREPIFIAKWHEEPLPAAEGEEQTDTGDRFTTFVFMPGQGGGPLLTQTANGFALQVFKDLEKAREFASHMFGGEGGPEIRNNREETEDMPECLRENFYYYNDNSWFYDI